MLGAQVQAKSPELWFAPTLIATANESDFDRLFEQPTTWPTASTTIRSFAIPVNYLLNASPETVSRELLWLRSHNIPLSVSVPILPVDKNVCGFYVEGMVWPGEASVMGRRLSMLGIVVDSFTLDLPLTGGHFSKEKGACRLSIKDTAGRLAKSIHELQEFYPHARIIDTEVPTGMPPADWASALVEWLDDFKEASGEDFDGLILDVWWPFPWQEVTRESIRILAARHMRSGIILDADGSNEMLAVDWIKAARRNGCAIRELGFDIVGIANWLDVQVHNLPETDPNTLTGLVNWFDSNGACPR
jgi:hypothetical protein